MTRLEKEKISSRVGSKYIYMYLVLGLKYIHIFMYLYLEFKILLVLVLVLRAKVFEKYQVHSSTNKYIVFNQKLYTDYRF